MWSSTFRVLKSIQQATHIRKKKAKKNVNSLGLEKRGWYPRNIQLCLPCSLLSKHNIDDCTSHMFD